MTSHQRAKRLDREVFKDGLVLLGVTPKLKFTKSTHNGDGSIPIPKRIGMTRILLISRPPSHRMNPTNPIVSEALLLGIR